MIPHNIKLRHRFFDQVEPEDELTQAARLCSLLPPLMGGFGATSSGYQIARSLRYRSSASAYLSRTPGAGTSNKTFTISDYVKRGALGVEQVIFGCRNGSGNALFLLQFLAGDAIQVLVRDSGSTVRASYTTQAVFRDPTAWLHIVMGYDAAGTAFSLEVNGVAQSLTTTTAIQNVATVVGDGSTPQYIGVHNPTNSAYFDGCMASFDFIDGQKLAASNFGQFNSATGAWVPKAYAGTYGTNGFHLDFADNSGATASTIGKDTSGNGNNWTPSGISVTAGVTNDSLVDTPTNGGTGTGTGGQETGNYATWDPLAAQGNGTFSNSNLDWTHSSGSVNKTVVASLRGVTKFYGELTVSGLNNTINFQWGVSSPKFNSFASSIQSDAFGWGVYVSGGAVTKGNNNSTSAAGSLSNLVTGTVCQVAVDASGGNGAVKVWLGANNVWIGGGDPAAGTSPLWSNLPIDLTIGASIYSNGGDKWTLNAGQRPFAYTAPAGFTALCTQNLPTPPIPRSTDEFVTVIDTESNIDAALASARSGWASYLDIKKNRSNSETWAWQFSHDSSNEYAVSTTATRQAKRTNSGADNWVGYSIKIDGTAGMRAGSVSHTNGADTTVTHNAGNARCLIMLFPRAGGEVPVYHPDCTAGKLLNLTGVDAETTSATIKTVLANSFKIDTGTATGTYDYLVLPEVAGFFKLGKSTGNASADGPVDFTGFAPALFCATRIDSSPSDSWQVHDYKRDPYNVGSARLWLSESSAESASTELDFLSNGIKKRASDVNFNASGATIAFFSFAAVPSKYARAR